MSIRIINVNMSTNITYIIFSGYIHYILYVCTPIKYQYTSEKSKINTVKKKYTITHGVLNRKITRQKKNTIINKRVCSIM